MKPTECGKLARWWSVAALLAAATACASGQGEPPPSPTSAPIPTTAATSVPNPTPEPLEVVLLYTWGAEGAAGSVYIDS